MKFIIVLSLIVLAFGSLVISNPLLSKGFDEEPHEPTPEEEECIQSKYQKSCLIEGQCLTFPSLPKLPTDPNPCAKIMFCSHCLQTLNKTLCGENVYQNFNLLQTVYVLASWGCME